MYTPEASATIVVLADQLFTASFLPALAVMAVVGVAAVRDRVLPVGVGAVTLLLAAASLAATLVLGRVGPADCSAGPPSELLGRLSPQAAQASREGGSGVWCYS